MSSVSLAGIDLTTTIFTFDVYQGVSNDRTATNSYIPLPYRQMKFGNVVVSTSNFIQVSPTEISFTINTTGPIPLVWLSTSFAGRFSDNGFTLTPSTTGQKMQFTSFGGSITAAQLQAELKITTPVTAQPSDQ